ncbi:hypothetical protein JKP88DRAFT_276796 [Tribonema minus]|uniref:RNB domain-containing protein n=1 Tax=Tribonema minus TaxID=303371 RepID=A0A836CGT9_9STRA|nr:hypothetical protein JKP88DRAFT_276796 [Tribonema minus]
MFMQAEHLEEAEDTGGGEAEIANVLEQCSKPAASTISSSNRHHQQLIWTTWFGATLMLQQLQQPGSSQYDLAEFVRRHSAPPGTPADGSMAQHDYNRASAGHQGTPQGATPVRSLYVVTPGSSGPNRRPQRASSGGGGGEGNGSGRKPRPGFYEEYVTEDEALARVADGAAYRGGIRVNARNFQSAYVTVDGGVLPCDVYIDGVKARNRALDGDEDTWKPLAGMAAEAQTEDATLADAMSGLLLDEVLSEEEAEDTDFVGLSLGTLAQHEDISEEDAQLALDVEAEARLWRPLPVMAGGGCAKLSQETGEGGKLCPAGEIAKSLGVQPRGSNVVFKPQDGRAPNMLVPIRMLPREFWQCIETSDRSLFAAMMDVPRWSAQSKMPFAQSVWFLGHAGEVEAETTALLSQNGVNHGDFSPSLLHALDQLLLNGQDAGGVDGGWKIPASEAAVRRDLRDARIFTIDPPTARDLDDALHVTPLPDGTVEIGVHIADVSHFVPPGGELDREAQRRATTIYLVQRALPMLPPLLCERLCSLNPGVDRLAFSAIWRMNRDGTLVEGEEPWFGRTIIRSCCTLDYGTVQKVIEGEIALPACRAGSLSEEQWESARRPTGGHSLYAVAQDILLMHTIAAARRQLRFAASGGGALSMNRLKLSFRLRAVDTGRPLRLDSGIVDDNLALDMTAYPIRDSNRLVEEYMLLANYLVARRLVQAMPGAGDSGSSGSNGAQSGGSGAQAAAAVGGPGPLLRRHPPPQPRQLRQVCDLLKLCGVEFDGASSAAMNASLQALAQSCAPGSLLPQVVDNLVAGPMKPAQYIAAAKYPPNVWRHFALNIGCYTHFTSPIRRYADLMVHRLLGAILDERPAQYTTEEVEEVARHCNNKRDASKKAQERSDVVFLCAYLKRASPPRGPERAVVMSYGATGFTVFVPALGVTARLFLEDIGREGGFKCCGQVLTEEGLMHIWKEATTGPVNGNSTGGGTTAADAADAATDGSAVVADTGIAAPTADGDSAPAVGAPRASTAGGANGDTGDGSAPNAGSSSSAAAEAASAPAADDAAGGSAAAGGGSGSGGSGDDSYGAAMASKSWRKLDLRVMREVWIVCSAQETVPVQVRVTFLGPISGASS